MDELVDHATGRSQRDASRLKCVVGLSLAIAVALAGSALPAAAGQAGCCVCTSCTAPALFACRAALNAASCQTTCQDLGCSANQFSSGADCLDMPQCFGDCCDTGEGCSQVPQTACTPGFFFANSSCDGSNCLAAPPSATPTATGTATSTQVATATASDTPTFTHTSAATATASDTPTPTHTSAATATATAPPSDTPTATAVSTDTATTTPTGTSTTIATSTSTTTVSPSSTATRTASITPSPSLTPTPSITPSPSPTTAGQLSWLLDDIARLTTVFSPRTGYTFVHPRRGLMHSLDLVDAASRFCTQPGLFPQLRIDRNPQDCENECFIGIFPQDSTSATHIARIPALNPNRATGTFDVLIETVIGCQPGEPPTTLRMPAAITYTANGDCDGDGEVEIAELMLGVSIAIDDRPSSDCLAMDLDGDGVVLIHELLAAVRAALEGGGT